MNSLDESADVYHVLLRTIVKDIMTEVAVSVKDDFVIELKKAVLDFRIQNDQHHLTPSEVCKLLRISKPTLWQYTKENRLTALRIGRKVLYSREEINQKLNEVTTLRKSYKALDI